MNGFVTFLGKKVKSHARSKGGRARKVYAGVRDRSKKKEESKREVRKVKSYWRNR